MKKILTLLIGMSLLAIACKKVDGVSTSETAGKVLQERTWRMTGYYDDEVDKLVLFSGYAFTFNKDGTIFAKRDSVTFNGTWQDTVMLVDSVQVPSLRLTFPNSRPFNFISKNWEVYEKTTKEIHLRTQDLADGPYDHIFFRINY